MSLDDELQRLFREERLTLPVPPDATQGVLAGARRVRRRRRASVAAGGLCVAIAVIFGGVAVGEVAGTRSVPPAERPVPAPSTASRPPSLPPTPFAPPPPAPAPTEVVPPAAPLISTTPAPTSTTTPSTTTTTTTSPSPSSNPTESELTGAPGDPVS